MKKGRVYHSYWMSKYHIPPLPMWLVFWFVVPFENYQSWQEKRRDEKTNCHPEEPPF